MFEGWKVISTYTRSEALADGILIDVSKMAQEAGIKFPVAVTCGLYAEYIKPDSELEKMGQSIEGRLWDLLNVLRYKAMTTPSNLLTFNVIFLVHDWLIDEEKDIKEYKGTIHKDIALKAVCGPGDNCEPVITIMLKHED